jgi:hypothetical protein
MHFIMSSAFINIHLDIYRIIIISQKKVGASAMRKDSENGKKKLCFVVYEKKGRCFSPSAQKRSFVHSKADCTQRAEAKYITRYVQIYMSFSITILQKSLQNFCRKEYCSKYQASGRHTSALSNFSFGILCILKNRIRKVQISKEKIKVINTSLLPA